ncbi:MAG: nuclear transport factor 2 family protein [Phenylobacterium sp.]|uniref:nuclear transport factor 2 family protein n=1 Tax=Phenylobacterium sp. TaxID=1871053 RepID=UPI00391C7E5D
MIAPAEIAQTYIAAWNETDPTKRRALIADTWTADATYVDPLASVAGHEGVDALISGVQQKFPGFRFALQGEADGHGDHVRFTWGLGPEGVEPPVVGTDVVRVEDGRLKSVIGFLDRVPG